MTNNVICKGGWPNPNYTEIEIWMKRKADCRFDSIGHETVHYAPLSAVDCTASRLINKHVYKCVILYVLQEWDAGMWIICTETASGVRAELEYNDIYREGRYNTLFVITLITPQQTTRPQAAPTQTDEPYAST